MSVKTRKVISLLLMASLTLSFTLIFQATPQPVQAIGNTFYVSTSGNDNNNGTDPNTPWKTLGKVSSTTFNAGDIIQLKCGDTWSGGELILKGSGSSTNWIMVSSYGTGNKPVITSPSSDTDADIIYGLNQSPDPRTSVKVAVKIKNYGGWKIKDIKITNSEYGILVADSSTAVGHYDGIAIENVDFQSIEGGRVINGYEDPWPFLEKSTAIYIKNDLTYQSMYKNVTIKDCNIEDADCAIWIAGVDGALFDNIYTYDIHTEGFAFRWLNNATIQNCTIRKTGYPSGVSHGVAAVFLGCSNFITMQDCEITDTYDPATNDGVAIDFEGGSNSNITVKRTYIHDNDGSAFLYCNTGDDNYYTSVVDCILDNNGRETAEEVAFLRYYDNFENLGTISGNIIRKRDPNQYLNWIYPDVGETNSYPSPLKVSNNTVLNPTDALPFQTPPLVNQSNIAPQATVSRSSELSSAYSASKAVDGFIGMDGYYEWASNAETNPWIQLTWGSSKSIDRIRLFDRVNTSSWAISGTLTFSDGSSIRVNGGIRNDGAMREVTFPAKNVTWVKFTVDRSSGTNIGLSEIQAFQTGYVWSYTAFGGFSSTQGANQWYYKYLNSGTYYNMTWDATNWWWSKSGTYSIINELLQHPDTSNDSVRTWQAPSGGTATISGVAYLHETSGTNGVVVSIKKNNDPNTLWGPYTLTTASPSRSHNLTNVSISSGDLLYFTVSNNGDSQSDSTEWNPTIDLAGVPTPTPSPTPMPSPTPLTAGTYEDNDPNIVYGGTGWFRDGPNGAYYQNYESFTNNAYAYYEFWATGTRVRIYGSKAQYSGKIDVYVNDNYQGTPRNLYLPEGIGATQLLIYDSGGDPNTPQTATSKVRVVVREDKDPNSSDYWVGLDKIVID